MKRLKNATCKEIDATLSHWTVPRIPESIRIKLKMPESGFNVVYMRYWLEKSFALTRHTGERAELELVILDWLYNLVRTNIKKGWVFELEDVITLGYADCLGYAKLLCYLGQRLALDIGIVEVIVDNGGRYTPHYINLFRLSDSGRRFVDMWYGSTDIKHKRIGAQVKESGKWRIKDLDWDELERVEDIKSLPQDTIQGITCYIIGNRHLEAGIGGLGGELDKAIEQYNLAIKLYPNARFYYNRAVAYENKGNEREARRDYARAFKDEASIARVLAREHEEIISLMELDRKGIELKEQEIYLLHKGFITGQEVTIEAIAKQYKISLNKVRRLVGDIEAKLKRPQS